MVSGMAAAASFGSVAMAGGGKLFGEEEGNGEVVPLTDGPGEDKCGRRACPCPVRSDANPAQI